MNKDYRICMYNNTSLILWDRPQTLPDAVQNFLRRLDSLQALYLYDKGQFIDTLTFFDKDTIYTKRYRVTIEIPLTKIEIVYLNSGSLDKELIMNALEYGKEIYDGRV